MSKSELVGVGGGLKFLCVSLVFLTPAAILYGDAHAHAALAGHWSRLQPRFQMAFGALVLIDCLRIIFSILSGMALWRREKYAVKLAELYLLSVPVLAFAGQQLLSPWKQSLAYDPEWVLRHVAGPLFWVLYLERSRRVRNTFGAVVGNDSTTTGGAVKARAATAGKTESTPSDTSGPRISA